MKEYQFKVLNEVYLDVYADSEAEAVETLNASLHLLDEPSGNHKNNHRSKNGKVLRNQSTQIKELKDGTNTISK